MYKFHPTPMHIVKSIIRKHIPRGASNILDPSTGDGALLDCIDTKGKKLTCVDIDINRLDYVRTLFSNKNVTLINGDFLVQEFCLNSFDCIVCNPPFDGRNCIDHSGKKIPLEGAFLEKCMHLCSDKGRMIFILPSSVSKGSKLSWFRIKLLEKFHLSYSYKLPRFTFEKVEGDFSVLIFDKSTHHRKTILYSADKEIIVTDIKKLSITASFDADELMAVVKYKQFINANNYTFVGFNELFTLKRGDIKHNYKRENILHTTNYLNRNINATNKSNTLAQTISDGDWMIKRVARNLINSFIEYRGQEVEFTDCIIRIRNRTCSSVSGNLFALSVILQYTAVKELLVKGSGAKYLDVKALKSLPIPINLARNFPIQFLQFINSNAVSRLEISRRVASLLEYPSAASWSYQAIKDEVVNEEAVE